MKVQTILGEIEVESEATNDNPPKKGDRVLDVYPNGNLSVFEALYDWGADNFNYPRKNYILRRAPRLIRCEHKLPNGQILVVEGPGNDIECGTTYDYFCPSWSLYPDSWSEDELSQGGRVFRFPSGSWRIVEVRDA